MANDEKKKTEKIPMSKISIDFADEAAVAKLIASFGGLRPLANDLGLAVGTVQGWKQRKSIPLAHQQRIRELLSSREIAEKDSAGSDTSSEVVDNKANKPSSRQNIFSQDISQDISHDISQSISTDIPTETFGGASSDDKQTAIDEGIVSAFTSDDGSSSSGKEQDIGLDISSDVWEHAALPRSTSGHWAILISCIALLGVLTRPLWSERIDAKLMATIAGGDHDSETHAESESHTTDSTADSSEHSSSATQADSTQADSAVAEVPQNLLERLLTLEKEVSSVVEGQTAPAEAEMRRLKSESSALAAAFDNQAARLDSFSNLLEEREDALATLRQQVERVEQNDSSARLARRLNAIFELDNIAYTIAQNATNDDFSLRILKQKLEQSLPTRDQESLSHALTTLEQANNLPSARQLLADYRLLLPDLLSLQAHSTDAGLGARLRAQLFTVFSIRRRGDESDENPFLKTEQLLEDHSSDRAEQLLREATEQWFKSATLSAAIADGAATGLGDANDPSSLHSRLASFQTRLATRNGVFAALREIRQKLSSDNSLSQKLPSESPSELPSESPSESPSELPSESPSESSNELPNASPNAN